MITKQTAYDIWIAYDEIDKSDKLKADMEEQIARSESSANLRDAFGRPRSLTLGIPSGDSAHRLLDVPPELAVAVIIAHRASKVAALSALNDRAKREANS